MDVKLENLSGRPLWIRLLSGESVDMSPAASPVVVSEREVKINPSIRKLLERGAIRQVQQSVKNAVKEKASRGTTRAAKAARKAEQG